MNRNACGGPAEDREQTLGEEIANAVTHGVGALLALACLSVGVVFASLDPWRDPWNVVAVAVYGFTMVLLYTFSTLYHAINRPKTKAVMNYFDHCSIYLLIAGSYTPFCLSGIRHFSPGWAWGILGAEWLLAVSGIVFQCLCINRYRRLSNATYLLMGWVVVVACYPLSRALGFWPLFWTLAGGLFYTFGVFFYVARRRRFAHMVWHLFVLAGTLVQYFTILFYLILVPHA